MKRQLLLSPKVNYMEINFYLSYYLTKAEGWICAWYVLFSTFDNWRVATKRKEEQSMEIAKNLL